MYQKQLLQNTLWFYQEDTFAFVKEKTGSTPCDLHRSSAAHINHKPSSASECNGNYGINLHWPAGQLTQQCPICNLQDWT